MTSNAMNRYADRYSDDDHLDSEMSGSIKSKSKPNSIKMSNSSARISPTPFVRSRPGSGPGSGPGSASASWRRGDADEYSSAQDGEGDNMGFAQLTGRTGNDGNSSKNRGRDVRGGRAGGEIGPDGKPVSFIPRKGGRVRLSIVKGQMVFSDLERSVAGDYVSDQDSDSENDSTQSPTNTIPPETPALSPFLTGRKGPLPDNTARPRFSPRSGRSDKKTTDFLSLDNFID